MFRLGEHFVLPVFYGFGFIVIMACSESANQTDETEGVSTDSDVNGDTDSDADSDGDTDADSDADTDGSTGCGATNPPSPCSTSGSPCTIDVDGTPRTFYVQLPDDYDPDRSYPVVFLFHPMGGTAEMAMTMYRIRQGFPDAVYVSPQGLESDGTTGWPNTGGQDVAFTRAMMNDLEAKYCVDKSRYFSTGFSYGGIMSDTLACGEMSEVFRAIAPMAGAVFGRSCSPRRPLAAWISHGEEDSVLDYTGALPVRDALVEANHCDSTTQPVDPSPCIAYDGCDPGYPVVWCLNSGQDHSIPDYGPTAIAEFFMQF